MPAESPQAMLQYKYKFSSYQQGICKDMMKKSTHSCKHRACGTRPMDPKCAIVTSQVSHTGNRRASMHQVIGVVGKGTGPYLGQRLEG